MEWTTPEKPAELTENRLIDAILEGIFPIDSFLPGERELAQRLKVTRPTLREAIQRLSRDGWLEIHQGKPTRVRDYWKEGSLGVLGAIARRPVHLPKDFISHLLFIRLIIAPAYTRLAVENDPQGIASIFDLHDHLSEIPEVLAEFDWNLHYQLTIASANPIFTLILNGFAQLYAPMACRYFELPESRRSSHRFYMELQKACRQKDAPQAEIISRRVMQESLRLWANTEIQGNEIQDQQKG